MGFDTDIYYGFVKMRAATILGDIFCLHKLNKYPLKYFHTISKYGNLVSVPASDTQESFSRSARDEGFVDEIILH